MKRLLRLEPMDLIFFLYLVLYFGFSMTTLVSFPFVHSDESWLSALTRDMMAQGSFSVTESSFDLYPREPHAIKTLFHLMQMPLFLAFGYSVGSARLLSLLCSILALLVFYLVVRSLEGPGPERLLAVLFPIFLSLDAQFLYAAHFARQEMVLLLLQMILIYLRVSPGKDQKPWYRTLVPSAVLLGISIGIHPNSFLLAAAFLSYDLFQAFRNRIPLRQPLVLLGATGLSALGYVLLSFWMNPDFLRDYLTYGATLGVTASPLDKVLGVIPFVQKLFYQISGTYYTPDIRWFLLLIPVAFLIVLVLTFTSKMDRLDPSRRTSGLAELALILMVMTLFAIMVIGRYSQPSILFLYPSGYLLIFLMFQTGERFRRLIPESHSPRLVSLGILSGLILLGAISLPVTGKEMAQQAQAGPAYQAYLERIQEVVPRDAKVLGNLNADYAFDQGALLDYRNLGLLEQEGLSFADYVRSRGIQFILYPSEMDLIYQQRPIWNDMYGNLYPYYEEMQEFLGKDCDLLDQFPTPYAMRIARRFPDDQAVLTIYQVKAAQK